MSSRLLIPPLLLGLLLTGDVAATAAPRQPSLVPLSREGQQRAAARQQRIQLAKDYVGARLRALSSYLGGLERLAGWLVEQKAKTETEGVLAELAKEDPKNAQGAKLKADAAAITAPQPLTEAQKKEYDQRLAAARRAGASGLLGLARKCNNAGLVSYAYDLLQDVLLLSADDSTARSAMGFVKVGNEWLPTFVANQQKAGLKYLPNIGWVPIQSVERIGKGEWQEGGKWMKLEDADRLHASIDSPWVVETENFTLKSTCARKQALHIAEKLEAIRQCCYRQYLDYFRRGSDKRGAQLLFNMTSEEKLVVNYFATKADYEAEVRRGKLGANLDLLLRSGGFYSPVPHASYFYHLDYGRDENLTTMQHEVTHQILGEYTHGGSPPVWLAEGMAETLEYAQPDAEGHLKIPSGRKHPDVRQAADWLKQNALPPIENLLNLNANSFHAEPGRHRNYQWAGAFCRFLMEFEDGTYSTDFLEYAYDAYARRAKTSIADYLGLSTEALDKAFRGYLKD